MRQDSSVSKVTAYRLENSWLIFLCHNTYPLQRIPGVHLKGEEADHSNMSSGGVNDMYSSSPTSLHTLMTWCFGSITLNLHIADISVNQELCLSTYEWDSMVFHFFVTDVNAITLCNKDYLTSLCLEKDNTK